MTLFVGIDPGVHACGVAACDERGRLVGAMWARSTTADAVGDNVVSAALEGVRRVSEGQRDGSWFVGIEFPEVAQDGRARGAAKTEDLLELSYVIGRVQEAVEQQLMCFTARVLVGSWKRNVNTDVLAARLNLAPPVGLTPAEHAAVVWPAPSYRHNVVDAIALARWLAAWPGKNPSKKLNDFAVL